jgi:glycosyltransferase involved in cell wall biosynthesis
MSEGHPAPDGGLSREGWCCFQAGHRERYAVPRALLRAGVLDTLVTDLWVRPGTPIWLLSGGIAGRRMRDRYHPELPLEKVRAFGTRTLIWEVAASMRGLGLGQRLAERDSWWTRTATRSLRRLVAPTTGFVFVYCYEARDTFRAARDLGLTSVLGQIDPGPVEDRKVAEIVRRWPEYRTPFKPGSEAYYARWKEECRLAGHVVVNSDWSAGALAKEGVDPAKVSILPLVYTPPAAARGWKRDYPKAFGPGRPLRVLFLGQCILRKGIAETIGAAQALADRPIEFTFVGNTDIENFKGHFGRAKIRYFPRVSREDCEAFYRKADVFLFPTHSDGFGLTQLEAQAWGLPIVASRFCANVVSEGQNGWVLETVSVNEIAGVLADLLEHPEELSRRSERIGPWPFGLDDLGRALRTLVAVEAKAD